MEETIFGKKICGYGKDTAEITLINRGTKHYEDSSADERILNLQQNVTCDRGMDDHGMDDHGMEDRGMSSKIELDDLKSESKTENSVRVTSHCLDRRDADALSQFPYTKYYVVVDFCAYAPGDIKLIFDNLNADYSQVPAG